MFKLIKKILNLSGKYKRRIIWAFVFSIIKAIASKMPIFLAFCILAKFYNNTLNENDCIIVFAEMVCIIIIQIISQYTSDFLQSSAGYKIFAEKRIQLGKHLRKLHMGYFTEGNIGKISSVISTDMIFIEENVMTVIANTMGYIFTAIIMAGFVMYFNMYLGIAVIIFSFISVYFGEGMNKMSLEESCIRQEQSESLTKTVIEFIEGIGVIKSYNLLGKKSAELSENFKRTRDTSLKFERKTVSWMRRLNIIYSLGISIILGEAVYFNQNGLISVESILGLVLFVFDIFGPLKALYGGAARFTVMNSCIDRIEDLFGVKELDDSGDEHILREYDGDEIEFEHVSFGYKDKNVINDVNFKMKKNSMTALVGPSGGGKSTIANLLVRFWDINEGCIRIRGKDIRKVPLAELMENVSMVFQRVYLFQDTIYNNISMGKAEATKEEVYEAAKKARCYDFIMSLPDKFETVIGEGGATLSGGEKQRISIARCILKDAPIVILDEATASIDTDNEIYIQEAISELVKDKTLLVIAHRLNTIKNAEKILVISNGKIAEEGTHEQLIKKEGIYKKFVNVRECSTLWSI